MTYRSGDQCPKNCGGRLKVRTSRPVGESSQEQRYECDRCGHKEVGIVESLSVWRRKTVVPYNKAD